MPHQTSTGKIFGIGLSRTGTTSLHLALIILGKASVHYPSSAVSRWMYGNFKQDALSDFDACSDIPVAIYFRELDKRYPGSKFILTTRDEQGWLDSTREWWSNTPPSSKNTIFRDMVRLAAYGSANHCDDRFLRRYREHLNQVRDYFSRTSGALLELDISERDKWGKLSEFLNVRKPGIDYPHARLPHLGEFQSVPRADLPAKRDKLMIALAKQQPPSFT